MILCSILDYLRATSFCLRMGNRLKFHTSSRIRVAVLVTKAELEATDSRL